MPDRRAAADIDPEIEQLIARERQRLAEAAKQAEATRQAAWNLGTFHKGDRQSFRRVTQPTAAAANPALLGGPPRKPGGT